MIKHLLLGLLALISLSSIEARVRRQAETTASPTVESVEQTAQEIAIAALTEDQRPICQEYCLATSAVSNSNDSGSDDSMDGSDTVADSADATEAPAELSGRSAEGAEGEGSDITDENTDSVENSDGDDSSSNETAATQISEELTNKLQANSLDADTCSATCTISSSNDDTTTDNTSSSDGSENSDSTTGSNGSSSAAGHFRSGKWEQYGAFLTLGMIPFFLH